MSSEENDDERYYTCVCCDSEFTTSFYVCYKLHICCSTCRTLAGYCPICHSTQTFCCDLNQYETSDKGPIFDCAAGVGPLISLPEYYEDDIEDVYKYTLEENHALRKARMLTCHDCSKVLLSVDLSEHYHREHPDIPVCPIPPGGCLSFRIKLSDIPLGGMKRLQILKLVNHKQFFTCEDEEDRILFIMGTQVKYFKSHSVLLLWLASYYQGCSIKYSMEARGEMNDIASAMFTGNTVGLKTMEDVVKGRLKCEELGQYLCIKDSLLEAFEREGNGVIINTLIHDL